MDTLSCVRNEREFGGLMWRWNAVMLMPGSVLIADPGSVAIAFSAPQAARGSFRYGLAQKLIDSAVHPSPLTM